MASVERGVTTGTSPLQARHAPASGFIGTTFQTGDYEDPQTIGDGPVHDHELGETNVIVSTLKVPHVP